MHASNQVLQQHETNDLNNLHYIALRLDKTGTARGWITFCRLVLRLDKTGTARGWITFCRLALRLDNLCVVLAVIVIIKIIINSGEKRKKASMHASNQVLQQHETTTVPLR